MVQWCSISTFGKVYKYILFKMNHGIQYSFPLRIKSLPKISYRIEVKCNLCMYVSSASACFPGYYSCQNVLYVFYNLLKQSKFPAFSVKLMFLPVVQYLIMRMKFLLSPLMAV